jgi:hypothetical protein
MEDIAAGRTYPAKKSSPRCARNMAYRISFTRRAARDLDQLYDSINVLNHNQSP